MLVVMIREFVAICTYLEKSNAKKVKGYLIIGRNDLELLLDKNKYLTSLEKLKHWKALKPILIRQPKRYALKGSGNVV